MECLFQVLGCINIKLKKLNYVKKRIEVKKNNKMKENNNNIIDRTSNNLIIRKYHMIFF